MTPKEDRQAEEQILAEYLFDSDVYKSAERKGFTVGVPSKQELFIDIDSEADYKLFKEYLPILQRYEDAVITRDEVSPSGEPGHRHVTVEIETSD
jgi:hypothetical protein